MIREGGVGMCPLCEKLETDETEEEYKKQQYDKDIRKETELEVK